VVRKTPQEKNKEKWFRKAWGMVMKPIEVTKELVDENPNDMILGQLIRQYIRELEAEEKTETKHFADGFHEGEWERD